MGSEKKYTTDLTADRLREHFRYDPESGVFIRLRNSTRGRAGDIAGTLHKHGYLIIGVWGRKYAAHRLAWLYVTGEWPSDTIDHKDRNRLNNRWENLRQATYQEQAFNRSAWTGKTGSRHLGVFYRKKERQWTAVIGVAGMKKHLGYFDDEDRASEAYLAAKARLHPINTYEKAS